MADRPIADRRGDVRVAVLVRWSYASIRLCQRTAPRMPLGIGRAVKSRLQLCFFTAPLVAGAGNDPAVLGLWGRAHP